MLRLQLLLCSIFCSPLLLCAGSWQQGGTYQDIYHVLFTADGKHVWCNYNHHPPDGTAMGIQCSLFNMTTGETEYTLPPELASAIAENKTVMIAPDNTMLWTQDYWDTLCAYHVSTGARQWSHKVPSSVSALAIVDSGQHVLLVWKANDGVQWERRVATNGTVSAVGSIPNLGTFTDLTLAPDGTVVAIYSASRIEFYALNNSARLSTIPLQFHERVYAVSFGSTGTVSLVHFADNHLQVYKTATGNPRTSMPPLVSTETPMLYNNDSLLSLWKTYDTLATYNAFTGEIVEIHSWVTPSPPVFTHPTQPLLALFAPSAESSGGMPRIVYSLVILNSSTKATEQSFPNGQIHRNTTEVQNASVAFSHTSLLLAIAPPNEHRTIVRRVHDGSWFCTLPMEGTLAFTPNDSSLLVARNDTLYEWDYNTQVVRAVYHIAVEPIRYIYTSLYHPLVLLVGDSSVAVWNSNTHSVVHTWYTQGKHITHTRFDRWGNRCIVGTNSGTVFTWELQSGKLVSIYALPSSLAPYTRSSYDISPNGRVLAIATDKGVFIKDIAADTVLHELKNLHSAFLAFPYAGTIHNCLFSADGKLLFTSTSVHIESEGSTFIIRSTSIRAFDVETGQFLFEAHVPVNAPIQAVSPRNDHVFTIAYGNWTNCVQLPSALVAVPPSLGQRQTLRVAPNPFSHYTTIILPSTLMPVDVTITDVLGRIVRRFNNVDSQQALYWNGTDANGYQLGCAAYYCTVTQGLTVLSTTTVLKQ